MNLKSPAIRASALFVLPVLAQEPMDQYMGDWQGKVTIKGQTRNVAVYMIPHGGGKYEARFVSDFAQRGAYLYRLKGTIRDGQFKFMDDIPFDVGRVVGTTERGVVLDAALWSGRVGVSGAKGTLKGKL